jgi:hypothetical protein
VVQANFSLVWDDVTLQVPATPAMLKRHSCLAALPIIKDMTTMPEMASSDTAWEWAFAHLLPKVGVVAFSDLGLLRCHVFACLWHIALSFSTDTL